MSSPVRRSGRSRKQATSMYDDAREAAEEEEKARAIEKAEDAKKRQSRSSSSRSKSPRKSSGARGGGGGSAKKSKKGGGAAAAATRGRRTKAQPEEEEEEEEDEDEEMQEVTEEEKAVTEDDEEEEESDGEESDDNDEDFEEEEEAPKKSKAKGGRGKASASSSRSKSPKKVRIQVKPTKSKKSTSAAAKNAGKKGGGRKAPAGGAAAGGGRKGINNALATLAKKTLEEGENSSNSLVASLLQAHKPDLLGPASAAQRKRNAKAAASSGIPCSQGESVYTPNLTLLAKSIISQHNSDQNAAQVRLMNLIFRCVGGTTDSCLNPDEHVLEELTDEDWTNAVTDLVDDVRHTNANGVLICADPLGAVHAASKDSSKASTSKPSAATLGPREFRKIYEEFWYVLGSVALTDGAMANASAAQVSDDESEVPVSATIRYDAELVSDITNRLIEIAAVGQPDVRAAAVIAAYKMCQAVLDRTVYLNTRLEVADRQLKATKKQRKGNGGDKVESLQHQVDSLKRTLADLEEIMEGTMINCIFVHRYRDSSKYTRAASLEALSVMTLQRPELFLRDKYLKYFGWMMSDKDEEVRLAAIAGLLAPFEAVTKAAASSDVAALKAAEKIDLTMMQHVVMKFMKRLTDGVIDVSVRVQEKSVGLLLCLLREGFLDDVEDDDIWNQINIRALSKDTSPTVRRDALYFVLEQLEAFDEAEDSDDEGVANARQRRSKESTSASESSDRVIAQRLDAVASWIAAILTDGDIPLDKVKIEYSDYLVHSLRAMPEHRSLVTTWSAMLRAIGDDSLALTAAGKAAGDKVDVAKQRILVQMMAAAVKAEVGSIGDSSHFAEHVDPEVVSAELNILNEEEVAKTGKSTKRGSTGLQHEQLSIALLKALPGLLVKFKTDSVIIESLTTLPRYLLPAAFGLPQRKADFISLAKNLSEIYLQSSDETVLNNIALSLRYLSDGDHSRAPDGQLQMKKVTHELRDRLVDLFAEEPYKEGNAGKRKKSSRSRSPSKRRRISSGAADVTDDDSSDDEGTAPVNTEYGIFLNLMRLRILFKRCDLSSYLQDEDPTASDEDDGVEAICSIVADGLATRLKALKVPAKEENESDEDASTTNRSPTAWNDTTKKTAMTTAKAVEEGLELLMSATGWKLKKVYAEENLVTDDADDIMDDSMGGDDDEESDDHLVVRLRDRVIVLVQLCFEQFLDEDEEEEGGVPDYSREQIAFSARVQVAGSRVAVDLRSLFPKELAGAASPLLRTFAIKNDGRLIGGFVRCFRSKEDELRDNNTAEEKAINDILLLPLDRVLAFNWKEGNRREAGVALAHITGSGHEASALVASMSKVLKKIDPVRYLEAQMASLRQSFEDWIENEPAEIENDVPTDEEMQAFDDAEKAHQAQFHALEQQAWKLSQSLGVGKLNKILAPALFGFIQEGVRFAFSDSDGDDDDDEFALGTRLSFLRILIKYCNWAKKNKAHQKQLGEFIDQKEIELHQHSDFGEVHEEDLAALQAFRRALGLEPTAISADDNTTVATAPQGDDDHVTPSPASTAGRYSRTGSTQRSRMSSVSGLRSLSPLEEEPLEEDKESEEEEECAEDKIEEDGESTDDGGSAGKDEEDSRGEDNSTVGDKMDEDDDDDDDSYVARGHKKGKKYGSQSQSQRGGLSQRTLDPF